MSEQEIGETGDEDVGAATDDFALESEAAVAPKRTRARRAATGGAGVELTAYSHTDKRKNNPEVGIVHADSDPDQPAKTWAYDPHIDPALQFDSSRAAIEALIDDALASDSQNAMREALAELKRRQQPYLNWAGKAERTSFDVDTVSLHVHERVDPATILSAIRKRLEADPNGVAEPVQPWLFEPPFEALPLRQALDFYGHDKGWANRLIAGDSLLVMNSLLQKEGMAGQVQMIYFDPPYGIKYGSNFQPFTHKRDVTDGSDTDLTQEPEMIKAFRDTWELGIHSYLTYIRDRLILARNLLSECGSIFVQISDENVHYIRDLLDEVFGKQNFVQTIVVKKKSSSIITEPVNDFVLWAAKNKKRMKVRKLYEKKDPFSDKSRYSKLELSNLKRVSADSATESQLNDKSSRLLNDDYPMVSQDPQEGRIGAFSIWGESKYPGKNRHWTLDPGVGMERLLKANRLRPTTNTVRGVVYLSDFGAQTMNNIWNFHGESSPIYVVQTNRGIVERCLLMTTDPGDLVFDPTCGSGTTAVVAEKWGRRWVTCDTSRVAVTLAKQRIMTEAFDYYQIRFKAEGLKGGFEYKTLPNITLSGIANNPAIDEIYNALNPAIERGLSKFNAALSNAAPIVVSHGIRKGQQVAVAKDEGLHSWEVPVDWSPAWPEEANPAFMEFHAARAAMQQAMDKSIADTATPETLYDKPEVDVSKLRVTGPFTVEAVPSPIVQSLDSTAPAADGSIARSGETARQATWRDELLKTGIRGKGGQTLMIAGLETIPGCKHLHASGALTEGGARVVVSFGPEHTALEQRQVERALDEAAKLVPKPTIIIFCAFTFDPEAAKDIDETNWPGVTLLKAQMNTDLLTEDLKKARSNNQSFWLMGQPDVHVGKVGGQWQVTVNGFDYFDTKTGELVSGGKNNIAMWSLDTDYDGRAVFPRQTFFPMAGAKDGWNRLRANIRAELDSDLLESFHGTVSLPFDAGDHKRIAVKIVDDRGIESLKIVALDD